MRFKAVNLSRAALATGQPLWFRVYGSSMRPLLQAGDRVCLKAVEAIAIRRGDLVVYVRGSQIVIHRLLAIQPDPEGQPLFFCKGDALGAADPPVSCEAILGKVTVRERKGRTVSFEHGLYRLLNPLLARLSPYTRWLLPFLRLAHRLLRRAPL